MFQIFILYINLDIQIGFFGYVFGSSVFGLSIRVWLITFRVRICFVTPYKIYSDIFYISDRIRFGFWVTDFMPSPDSELCIQIELTFFVIYLFTVSYQRYRSLHWSYSRYLPFLLFFQETGFDYYIPHAAH